MPCIFIRDASLASCSQCRQPGRSQGLATTLHRNGVECGNCPHILLFRDYRNHHTMHRACTLAAQIKTKHCMLVFVLYMDASAQHINYIIVHICLYPVCRPVPAEKDVKIYGVGPKKTKVIKEASYNLKTKKPGPFVTEQREPPRACIMRQNSADANEPSVLRADNTHLSIFSGSLLCFFTPFDVFPSSNRLKGNFIFSFLKKITYFSLLFLFDIMTLQMYIGDGGIYTQLYLI